MSCHPLVYFFAMFGLLMFLAALVGGVLSFAEWYRAGFRYKSGDEVSLVEKNVILGTVKVRHYIVMAPFNTWYMRREYLVARPQDMGPAGTVVPLERVPESRLTAGWVS